jgi:hypothetical protein
MVTPWIDVIGHGGNIVGQAIASQVLLLDQQQIDTEAFGLLSDRPGLVHVRGIDRAVHTKPVENGFGFVDQGFGMEMGMNWVRSVFPSL